MSEPSDSLREEFGDIDVYLFDQLLRGRIVSGMKVLDAGCGAGRNLVFLMRAGFDVWGVDESPEAIEHVRRLGRSITPRLDADRFRVEPVESMSLTTVRWMWSSPAQYSTSRATKRTGMPWCTRCGE